MGRFGRGAITSLPKHQFESGQALGLSKVQLYHYIIIPQVLRRLLPQAINLITRMIKTTSFSGPHQGCRSYQGRPTNHR